jgi:hypothetical protein
MAVKTFTTEELTSADTNTYLANSGLVYVTSATVGTGVSSVTVSSAFNSTYDAYKIVATNVSSTGTGSSAGLQLSGITTAYYAGIVYLTYGSTVVTGSTDNNTSQWFFAGSFSSEGLVMVCDVINPFLAKPTFLASANYAAHITGGVTGKQTSSTSATGFVISTPGGTMTGGNITVYGYRKA